MSGILSALSIPTLGLITDWRSRLLPASFRGVPFQVESHDESGMPIAPTTAAPPNFSGRPNGYGTPGTGRIEALQGRIVIDINGAPPGTTATVTDERGVSLTPRVNGDTGSAFSTSPGWAGRRNE